MPIWRVTGAVRKSAPELKCTRPHMPLACLSPFVVYFRCGPGKLKRKFGKISLLLLANFVLNLKTLNTSGKNLIATQLLLLLAFYTTWCF